MLCRDLCLKFNRHTMRLIVIRRHTVPVCRVRWVAAGLQGTWPKGLQKVLVPEWDLLVPERPVKAYVRVVGAVIVVTVALPWAIVSVIKFTQ